MKELDLVERSEIVAKYSERCLLPIFKQWALELNKPLKFVDMMCAYGNDTLVYTNAYYQEVGFSNKT